MTFSLDSDEKNINTMSKHLDSHVHKENMKRVQRSKTNLYKNNQNKDLFCEICIFESFSKSEHRNHISSSFDLVWLFLAISTIFFSIQPSMV